MVVVVVVIDILVKEGEEDRLPETDHLKEHGRTSNDEKDERVDASIPRPPALYLYLIIATLLIFTSNQSMDLDPKLYENIHRAVFSKSDSRMVNYSISKLIGLSGALSFGKLEVIRDTDIHNVVLSYLVHNCFKDTVESFVSCTDISQPADCLEDIDRRRTVEFAKKQLRPFSEVTDAQKYMGKIEDHMALLAYNEPEKSPMFRLLSLDYRHEIADKLNRAILAHVNKPSYSSLERLIQQTTVVRQLLNQDSSKVLQDSLPLFSLKDFVKR
ncbi:hypothetical protein KSS87_012951 [Heliosperma pusillum]|nr:hypothetical protein KSS87_012951 [Heliosperma pusillum]